MTRIALLSPGYPPSVGGVQTVVAQLAEGLASRGFTVEAWTHERGVSTPQSEVTRGVTVRRFPTTKSDHFPFSPSLWRHVRRHHAEFDLLHAHSYHATAALAATVGASTPLVFSPHYHGGGHTPMAKLLHPFYRVPGRRLMAQARAIIAVSDAEKALLLRDFTSEQARFNVIHNGVDVEEFLAAPGVGDVGGRRTIVTIGRLERYKRIDLVIEAFARTPEPGRLVLIGDGPDRERLERLAEASPRAADIEMLGYVSRAEAVAQLRAARGVVSMSENEAFGIVGLEGVAAGARAVLSAIPAHAEVQQLVPAGLISIATPAELPQALTRLLDTPNEGPRDVRSWSAMVDDHVALYTSVLPELARS